MRVPATSEVVKENGKSCLKEKIHRKLRILLQCFEGTVDNAVTQKTAKFYQITYEKTHEKLSLLATLMKQKKKKKKRLVCKWN